MIAFLEGNISALTPTHCQLNVNGVGYEMSISLRTFSELQGQEGVKLFTQMIVREDAQLLYGFFTLDEKNYFNALISVNGVGPSSAMMMLSTLSVGEIKNAILSGNAALIQTVKGIGAKTAQRVIIDLKDKIEKIEINDETLMPVSNKTREESLNALEVLGVSKRNAEKMVDKILLDNPDARSEEVIKMVLKNTK